METGSDEDIIKNELVNDNETIARGLEKEVYEAAKFLDEKNYEADGISSEELKTMIDMRQRC